METRQPHDCVAGVPTDTTLCAAHTSPKTLPEQKLIRVFTGLIPGARNLHAVELRVGVRARVHVCARVYM